MAFPDRDGRIQHEAEMNRFAKELEHSGGPKDDPSSPPRERGDRAEILALLVGVGAGVLLGAIAAILADFINIFTGVIVGGIFGGLAGFIIGDRLKKRASK
jgi:hypothetical protein